MRSRLLALAAALGLTASPVAAHPHIFVDTGVQFLFDEAEQLAAIRVVWVYDELYSLLITEDMGLDPDFDGVLTPEELARLSGFDMNWDAGFAGDVRGFADERPIGLSRPMDWSADYRDGKIITTHVRALDTRLDPRSAEVVLRLYDPTFYTAYAATLTQSAEGAEGCVAEAVPFDPDTAYPILEKRLAEAEAAGTDVEMDFPEVGDVFADEVHLLCAP